MPRPDSSVVERGPEKAGVGGSIPSLATTLKSIRYEILGLCVGLDGLRQSMATNLLFNDMQEYMGSGGKKAVVAHGAKQATDSKWFV